MDANLLVPMMLYFAKRTPSKPIQMSGTNWPYKGLSGRTGELPHSISGTNWPYQRRIGTNW